MTDLYQSSITFSSTDDDSLQATGGLTVNQIHAELLRLADSSHAQGKQFERVMVRYFLQAPLYRDKVKAVQLWDEWAGAHGMDGRDVGIDLVAETLDGDYWAIQCKCYADTHTLQKGTPRAAYLSTARILRAKLPSWAHPCAPWDNPCPRKGTASVGLMRLRQLIRTKGRRIVTD